jgi:murein DD-endopeptidase MepM/ murein hydrolase activator NlpD
MPDKKETDKKKDSFHKQKSNLTSSVKDQQISSEKQVKQAKDQLNDSTQKELKQQSGQRTDLVSSQIKEIDQNQQIEFKESSKEQDDYQPQIEEQENVVQKAQSNYSVPTVVKKPVQNHKFTTFDDKPKNVKHDDSLSEDKSPLKRKGTNTKEFQKKTVNVAKKNDKNLETVDQKNQKKVRSTISFDKPLQNQTKGNKLRIGRDSLKQITEKYQQELENGDFEGVALTSKSITKTSKLTKKSLKKMRDRRIRNENLKKSKDNPLKKEQPKKESALKKLEETPGLVVKNGVKSYQQNLESDAEGVKLVSQGTTAAAKATKKLRNESNKTQTAKQKFTKSKTKLKKSQVDPKKVKIESAEKLKKKVYKKKMYGSKYRESAKNGLGFSVSAIKNRLIDFFKKNKLSLNTLAKSVSLKVAAIFGGGLASLIPIILVAVLFLSMASTLTGGISTQLQEQNSGSSTSKNLSPEVEKWRSEVEKQTKEQGMSEYANLLLAIMQVESGGRGTRDIMQSSESQGWPVNTISNEQDSIKYAIIHLKKIVELAKSFNGGYEKNYKMLAQAYNYGIAFAGYVGKLGGNYSLEVSEKYSREVVAPSLGNSSGITYPYINEVSVKLGKKYLYLNGGNFMYGDLVSEYLDTGSQGDGTWKNPVHSSYAVSQESTSMNIDGLIHGGIDLASVPKGAKPPVYAARAGTVIVVGSNLSYEGNYVMIQHEGGYYTYYGHFDSISVTQGQKVSNETVLGIMGETGLATGVHLHFEVRKGGQSSDFRINPREVIDF